MSVGAFGFELAMNADQLLFLTVSCLLVSRLDGAGAAGADAGRERRGGR